MYTIREVKRARKEREKKEREDTYINISDYIKSNLFLFSPPLFYFFLVGEERLFFPFSVFFSFKKRMKTIPLLLSTYVLIIIIVFFSLRPKKE